MLHMYVYQLLAEREGRRGIVSRTERAAATADDEADKVQGRGRRWWCWCVMAIIATRLASSHALCQRVQKPLPPDWIQIKDPLTGETCYWNTKSKLTVWTRPAMD